MREIRQKYPALYPSGLYRILAFLDRLGNPYQRLPFTFHVAGTNGKGSTLAFLQAIFEAGGLRVHKYISPHLVRFEERIVIGGEEIEPGLLLDLIHECSRASAIAPVSFFEFFTGLAFLAFARAPADALLLETGLGGLHDATNVIEGSGISLLTRISHDHTHVLGATLQEIALQKAGIIKPGCKVIAAAQPDAAVTDIFARQAKTAAAPLYLAGRDWHVTINTQGFEYRSAKNTFRLPPPRLQGQHQIMNAGTALAALENSPYAFLLQQKTLERAMHNVVWPGRLQQITEGSLAALLPPGWELWLDGAHNDSGAETLAAQARIWGAEKPLHLVTAIKQSKTIADFFQPLLPYAATVQAVDTGWIEAPMTPAALVCGHLQKMNYGQVKTAANLESALRALTFQFAVPQRILITGSLYLVGHALREQL